MGVRFRFWLAATTGLLCAVSAFAQSAPPPREEGVAIIVTVTATGRDQAVPPKISSNEVVVSQDGKSRKLLAWEPVQPGNSRLELAVLVDDSLSTRVAGQWSDLQNYLRTLPRDVRVAVAYANFGAAHIQQDFTTDHELAAKAFQIPKGAGGTSNGIYDSVADLIKKWPETRDRRVILLISSGIDLTNGIFDTQPAINGPLQKTIDQAQRSGVVVYSLYASGSGRLENNSFLISNGQGCLGRLAAETGGDSFFLGLDTPVSFQPFLQDIGRLLGQQYLLTFLATPGAKAGYAHLRVTVENNSVELLAADRVYVPGVR
jgi:VWFA-related protein